MSKRILSFLFLFLTFFYLAKSSEIDSLRNLLTGTTGREKVDLLNKIADQLNYASAGLQEALMADSLAQVNHYPAGRACAQLNLGHYYTSSGDHIRAEDHYLKALAYYQTVDDYNGKVKSIQALIQLKNFKNEFLAAFNLNKELRELAEQRKDSSLIAEILINNGEIYLTGANDYKRAKSYLFQAEQVRDSTPNWNRLYSIYFLLSQIYNESQMYDSSLHYIREVELLLPNLEPENRRKLMEAEIKQEKAIAWHNKGNTAEAITLIDSIIELSSSYDHPYIEAYAHFYLAGFTFAQNRKRNAFLQARKAEKWAKKYQDVWMLKDIYKIIRDYYRGKGPLDSAWHYNLLFEEMMDSVAVLETENRVEEWKLSQDLQNIERLAAEHQEVDRFYLFAGIGLVLALLIISTGFFYFYRLQKFQQNQKLTLLEIENKEQILKLRNLQQEQQIKEIEKKRLTEQLDQKKRELTSHLMQLSSKNKIFHELKEEFASAFNRLSKPAQATMTRLSKIINEQAIIQEDWQAIEHHFEQVHPQFFQRLKQQYPDLTNNDLRLCAFIRINLSPKEIAQLMQIDNQSVLKSRYRLRKKMKLEKGVKLDDIIKTI